MPAKRKIVMISNRLPPRPERGEENRAKPVGGLASALFSLLDTSGSQSLWFGWNGRITLSKDRTLTTWRMGNIDFAGIDFSESEIEGFYNGFCNRTLWPLFHCFQARIKFSQADFNSYIRVNMRMAQELAPLISKNDTIWVHDYHLMPLGSFLKAMGFEGAIGFFLHIPFPPIEFWQILPKYEKFAKTLLAYDLVGFQTPIHLENYINVMEKFAGAKREGDWLKLRAHRQMVGAYPIGIDPERFATAARAQSFRGNELKRIVGNRYVILGVDRLDYTKGIDARIQGFHRFLETCSDWRNKVCFIQIAPPSRTHIPSYLEAKRQIDAIVGEINGEFGEYNWTPVRFIYRSYGLNQLARFYRDSDVCIVSSFRDGMNLVAKEFIASQDPKDPGVLLLSQFTGAAEEMNQAIMINPYSPDDIADGIFRALTMPLEERKSRFEALLKAVKDNTVFHWGQKFIEDLDAAFNLRKAARLGKKEQALLYASYDELSEKPRRRY